MGHGGQTGRGRGTAGEGKGKRRGKGGGKPPQPDGQAVLCIPPGIKQMRAHVAHQHHQPIYNIDPDV